MSKDHFYFNRNDRIVALILLSIILVVNIFLNPWTAPVQENAFDTDSLSYAPDTFRRTVYIRDTVRRKWYVWDTVTVEVKSVRYVSKTRPDEPLDLNAVDSTELVKLPGIGYATAYKIIRYREQLGGYTDIGQMAEIEGLPDSLMKWFIITDTIPIRQIPVNTATLSELRRHPYMDFYQARAIVEYRRERGMIKGPEQLSFMEEFTVQDLKRLEPYLDFKQDQ
ncbi:MAG: helix-hairpin-helix domain-containing protein [Bacteroidaceae bacterium]|nr:helix-hairpin-helix domain-containing protein [Bacteroidaceae bacterium]